MKLGSVRTIVPRLYLPVPGSTIGRDRVLNRRAVKLVLEITLSLIVYILRDFSETSIAATDTLHSQQNSPAFHFSECECNQRLRLISFSTS